MADDANSDILCELCYNKCNSHDKHDGTNFIYALEQCDHSFCFECLRQYLKYQIVESRVAISCPKCAEKMHPNEIYNILLHNKNNNNNANKNEKLNRTMSASSSSSEASVTAGLVSNSPQSTHSLLDNLIAKRKTSKAKQTDQQIDAKNDSTQPAAVNEYAQLVKKYEEFMVRRVLVTVADTRWCPAPDCTYAVIATGCANCPQLFCLRPGCNTSFCYHCKQYWHANMTCEEAALKNSNAQAAGILASIHAENGGILSGSNSGAPSSSTNKFIRSILERSNSHISTTSSNIAINLPSAGAVSGSSARATGGDWCKEEIKRCPKCLSKKKKTIKSVGNFYKLAKEFTTK
jgi:hypothetical protein